MKTYTVVADVTVCFTVEARNESEANAEALMIIDSQITALDVTERDIVELEEVDED